MQGPAIQDLLLIPGSDPHDPETLFTVATAYAHAGLIVSAYGARSDRLAFTFPAVVCSSFALELFLKFFVMVDLIQRGKTSERVRWKHELPSLWSDLTPAHKALIAGMYRNPTEEPYTNGKEIRLRVFEDALQALGDKPFNHWRYVHEHRDPELMSHDAICEVVDALQRAAQYVFKRMSTRRPSSQEEL